MECRPGFHLWIAAGLLSISSGCHMAGCKVVQVPANAPIEVPLVDVTGTVARPTAVPIHASGLKLWSAVIRAGGVTGDDADISRTFVSLHRANCEYHFALPLVEGDYAGDIQLAPGDIVSVGPVEELLHTRAFVSESAQVAEFADPEGLKVMNLSKWETNHSMQVGTHVASERLLFVAPQEPDVESPPQAAAQEDVGSADPPLGACEAINFKDASPPLSSPNVVLLDSEGNAAMTLVVSRDATSHTTDRELFVLPSSLMVSTLGNRFDPKILEDFVLRQGDSVNAANLEQIPLVSSSLIAPYLRAEQQRLNQARVAANMARLRKVPFDGVPVLGTVSHCLCDLDRPLKTVTVETYPVPSEVAPVPRLTTPYVADGAPVSSTRKQCPER